MKKSSPTKTTPFRLIRQGDRVYFFLAFLFLVFAAGCVREEERVSEIERDAQGGVTVEKITENPERYVGESVLVSAEIKRFYQPGVFAISDEGPFESELIVVTTEPLPLPKELPGEPPESMKETVRVAGTVKRFVVAEIERDLGFDLESRVEAEIEENQPVLVAQSVSGVPHVGLGGGTLDGEERGSGVRGLGPP